MRICLAAFFCLFCLLAVPRGMAAPSLEDETALEIENLRPESEIIHYANDSVWVGTNGIIVRYGSVVLTAETARVNEMTKDIVAAGSVTLQREGVYWKGESLEYNFESKTVKSAEFRAGLVRAFVGGVSLESVTTNNVQILRDAYITTDDLAEPSFRIRAKSMKVTLGKSIDAKDATLYVGNTPVLWFPSFHRSLVRHHKYFVFTPGYRSSFGPYLLNQYQYELNDHFEFGMNLDYRAKRGVGFGPELRYDLGRAGHGDFSYYQAEDRRPGLDFDDRPIDHDRHRTKFDYQVLLRTNLTAKIAVREQSDEFVVRDFFEHEYRTNSQPITFAEVNQLWSNASLDLLVQPQVNSFYETVERLPDLRLSGARMQVGQTPVFYETDSSVAYLRFRPGNPFGTNYAALRADSYHQLLLPKTYFGWLNVAPRVGGRITHYGESEGKNVDLREEDRFVFNTGAEASFKASRVWPGARNSFFDITGLRHIIEPSFNYVFVPEPNVRPHQLPQFDTELPSLRLLPVDFPDYNQIDSIDTRNVIRLGLRNKLQTKREGEVWNVVNWALVTDLRLDSNPGQQRFSDVYSDLDFQPRKWITFNSELRYAPGDGHFNAANHSILLTPNDTWNLRLGHRYFRGGPEFGPDSSNNTYYDTIYFKLNENWAFRVSHHFEARDGKMEEQFYTVYRDFRSWTGALTFRIRDNRSRPDDFTVAFTFSLKAFPTKRLGSDQDTPSLLLGG